MKVYISVDMEGLTGVSSWDEVTKAHADYPRFRRQMTREAVAACEGALAAGATELLVKDAHATGRNLDGRDLPREARLVSGWSGHPLCMVQELDASFAAALFVGYHAWAGSPGNPLAHTLSSSKIAALRLNGELATEYLLHAYAAELHEVPVALVSGDEALCAHVARYSPGCRTVQTQAGVGPSVVARHPDDVLEELRRAAQETIAQGPQRCRLPRPERYRLEITYRKPTDAYGRSFYPGAERAGPATVAFESEDYFEVLRAIRFCL